MKKWMVMGSLILSSLVFTYMVTHHDEYDPVPIPPSEQRTGGDVQKGFDYLTTGDYVKSGVPLNIFTLRMGKDKKNYLHRTGKNENLSFEYTAITARERRTTGSTQLFAMPCAGNG